MGDYVGRSDPPQALDCRRRRREPRCAGPARRPAPGGFTYGDYGSVSSASPRSTPTARSGRRRCGICARRSVRPRRARVVTPQACGSRRPSRPSSTRATRSSAGAAPAERAAVWKVFAARGMGYYASTTGSEDVTPIEDFDARRPAPANGTIGGVVPTPRPVDIGGATMRPSAGSRPTARGTAPTATTRSTLPRRAAIRASSSPRPATTAVDRVR